MGLFTNLFSSTPKNKTRKDFVFLMGHYKFDVEVTGEKNFQAALEAICGPRVPTGKQHYENAWLIQEEKDPQNNRVCVEIRGRQVGYLSPVTAVKYRKHLESQGTPGVDGQCQALIQGGWMSSDGRKGLYSVSLDLPL
jgi:hypothetical protein